MDIRELEQNEWPKVLVASALIHLFTVSILPGSFRDLPGFIFLNVIFLLRKPESCQFLGILNHICG